ncbi:glycosyltransferase family 39 protein [Candidatus Sumerlaeota bacterium]|nr:glycosyltransferase family 39 protein [Candidatus Sumerlaeota bacterium]
MGFLLATALVAGFVVESRWTRADRDTLVARYLYEDAFYYFQTARNIAEGRGSTSSGGILHNGYHPLWLILCTAFFRATPSDQAAIQSIMLVGAMLSTAAAFVVYLILRKMGCRRRAAVFAAACFQLNPDMMSLAVSGMEAPMNALLIALTVFWAIRPQNRPSGRPYFVVLGILMGLTYLVRTDNVFFLAATWLYLAWRGRSAGATWIRLIGAGLLALALAAPWFVWNLVRFGGVMQTSAGALPVVRRAAFLAAHPGAGPWELLAHRTDLLLGYFPAALMYSGIGSVWYVMGFAVACVLWTRRGRDENPRLAFALFDLSPLLVAAICLGIAHKFFRLATREWYYVTTDLFLALLWGLLIQYMMQVLERRLVHALFLLFMTALVAFMFCVKGFGFDMTIGGKRFKSSRQGLWTKDDNAFALEIVRAIDRLRESVPAEEIGPAIGVTDSGVIGFYSPLPVVNLDGVVNPEAARAIRRGELLKYIEEKGIRYAVVTPRMVIERIWGEGFRRRLIPYPALTAEGYRYE